MSIKGAINKLATKDNPLEPDKKEEVQLNKVGRPKIKTQEKRNIPLNIMLTQTEYDAFIHNAGMVNKSVFARACLEKAGVFK